MEIKRSLIRVNDEKKERSTDSRLKGMKQQPMKGEAALVSPSDGLWSHDHVRGGRMRGRDLLFTSKEVEERSDTRRTLIPLLLGHLSVSGHHQHCQVSRELQQ